jgi:hypothetical protein
MTPDTIRTIADLKLAMQGLSDDTRVYFHNGTTVYDLSHEFTMDCCEHNGKEWTAKGFILEVD